MEGAMVANEKFWCWWIGCMLCPEYVRKSQNLSKCQWSPQCKFPMEVDVHQDSIKFLYCSLWCLFSNNFHTCTIPRPFVPPPLLTGKFSDLLSLVGTYDFRSYDSDPQKAKADLYTPTNPSFLSVESSTWELLFVESLVFSTNNL